MPDESRNHHHIPQCYLRGFALGAGKSCVLQAANLKRRTWFESSPRRVAVIHDFNRVNLEGHPLDALEKLMVGFEGLVATAIRNVSVSHKFEGDDRNIILNLMALVGIRSPQNRAMWRKWEERALKQMLGLTLTTKERWENQQRDMKEAGYKVEESVTYEQMVEFFKQDEYNVSLDQETHIRREIDGHDTLLGLLSDRKWTLCVTTDEVGQFITSDHPLILYWREPEKVPIVHRRSAGYGMADTEVMFPLTRHLALVGMFDGDDKTLNAETFHVSLTNGRTVVSAFNQVYAAKKTFPYVTPDLRFWNDKMFMERLAEYRRNKPDAE